MVGDHSIATGAACSEGEVGVQQSSEAATSREFEFTVLMSLPRLGRRADQIFVR